MGYETWFVVLEPKTGQEIFEQIKTIDDKLGPEISISSDLIENLGLFEVYLHNINN